MLNNEQLKLKLAKVMNQYIKDLGDDSFESIVQDGYTLAVSVIDGRQMPTPQTPTQNLKNSCAEMMLKEVGFQKPLASQGHPGADKALQGHGAKTK